MYQWQQRGEKKKDSRTRYNRKLGRPGGSNQLQYKRVSSGKVGGAIGLPPPSPSSSSASPSLVYRIVEKSRGEGNQSRVPNAIAESGSGTSGAPTFNAAIKPINTKDKKNIQTSPKTPPPQSISGTSDISAITSPIRDNISKGEPLQFGSFSTGAVNGLQVSAAPFHCTMHTSSFIPLDEVSGTLPYQQPHVPIQAGFPSSQFQNSGMPFSSYQIPVPFIAGFQPSPFPPQGGIHQGQLLNIPHIHDYPLGSQFGGVGFGVSPHHIRKNTAHRTVKITHPETHEELIFNESVDAKLAGGSAGMPSYHHHRDVQPQPFYYGPSDARNCSHMQPDPTPVLLTNTHILSDLPTLGQKSSANGIEPFKVKGKPSEEVNSDYSSVSNLDSAKSAFSRRREKRKEILKNADTAGSTADLYMPCMDPKKKMESSDSSEVHSRSCFSIMQVSSGSFEEDATTHQNDGNTTKTYDCKNTNELSTQKLKTSSKTGVVHHKAKLPEGQTLLDGKKRYSMDFLINLSSNLVDLPADFELASDAAEHLLGSNATISKLVKHSPKEPSKIAAQIVSQASGISRLEYRAIGAIDNAKRAKSHANFASGPEPCNDANQSVNNYGTRPGQRGNYGVGRNLQVHASGFSPMQHKPPNGNKWQRASRSLKGMVPSPQPSLQFMHKAEEKYEVRKVNDVEEGKQRQLKAILNKLTPQNFERLFQQVKDVTIDNTVTLAGIISQIFDKALMEPTFCEMYVDFCYHLASELPDFFEDDQRITFKRLLLDKCQEEFERGEKEQAEAEKVEEGGEFKQSDQEREEKRTQTRRRMLGNIRLIGELYKNKMLTERIMHECVQKLLGQDQNPNEEDIEALCKLMCTIGEMIDHDKAKDQMDAYFEILSKLSNNSDLSSRLRFMLMDVIDMRKNNWQQRMKVEGPKKIEELRRDAHQERQTQTGRVTRDPNNNPSRRAQLPEINSCANTMLSQKHGFGNQDVRLEDKHSSPLPHTPFTDSTTNIGCAPPTEVHSISGETMSIPGSSRGHTPLSGLLPYNAKQEPISRYSRESFAKPSAYAHSIQQADTLYAHKDVANLNYSFGISTELSSAHLQNLPAAPYPFTEKALPEECLAELSISAIREFYSAVDENEVVLCIRELNSPCFLPKLVSLWVNDSFERKDRERILLSRLLVNLTRSWEIMDSEQLIDGFESVLATLEDAITDAPKAAAFLGSMFGTMIIENVISLEKIASLLRESGKKPGHFQIGVAHEVLKNAFEMIKSEKGESFFREICMSSNIQLDDFSYQNLPSELVSH